MRLWTKGKSVSGGTTHPNLMPKPFLDRSVLQEELLAHVTIKPLPAATSRHQAGS